MPELPEVETVARRLAPLIQGRRIVRFEVYDRLLALPDPGRAAGREVAEVHRLGKQVVARLEGPRDTLWLGIHLRMTGQLQWTELDGAPAAPPLRARMWLTGGVLLFSDVRRFGTIRLAATRAAFEPAGLDPLAPSFTTRRLSELIGGSRQPVKAWLMRQDRLVGLGNIYVSEALFAAGIDPRRPVGSLDADERARLHRGIRRILRRAIEDGGTTLADRRFEDPSGRMGYFRQRLAVYGRKGEPCPRCATPVARIVQQQRSSFFCPHCQA